MLCSLYSHDIYRGQYRAMFVMNCVVKRDQVLKYKPKTVQQRPRSKKQARQKEAVPAAPPSCDKNQLVACAIEEAQPLAPNDNPADGCYRPVLCCQCTTEVAVFDTDEVYHFFNVLAGHA